MAVEPGEAGPRGQRGAEAAQLSYAEQLSLLQWHIDRYDRLRASTASRASVVLSAGAILSAGNAVVLTQLLGDSADRLPTWTLVMFTVLLLCSIALVVLAVIRAAGVLVTLKASRQLFTGAASAPRAPLFNAPDTLLQAKSFGEFTETVRSQRFPDILESAQVELWIVIQQHRHRYASLRAAVRILRWAALSFLLILVGLVMINLATRI